MEDIMKDTPQEDTLDELCHILFGKELEEMMQRKHFQSYDELNCKVKQLENTVDTLNKAFDSIDRLARCGLPTHRAVVG